MEIDALRLAVVIALLNGGHTPYPTLAEKYVYDSMIDDLLVCVPKQRRPVIIVRTDEDQELHDRGGTFRGRQCRVLIEMAVLTGVEATDGRSLPDWPKTDLALELQLGIMYWQVYNALRGHSLWAQWFKEEAGYSQVTGWQSVPRFSPPNRGSVRLAARTIDAVFTLHSECLVMPLKESDPVAPKFLPPSLVRVVNKMITDGSDDMKTIFTGLAGMLHRYAEAERPRYPALQTVWGTYPQQDELQTNWPIEQVTALEQAAINVGNATVGSPDIVINP
jgi:hypothetical protein